MASQLFKLSFSLINIITHLSVVSCAWIATPLLEPIGSEVVESISMSSEVLFGVVREQGRGSIIYCQLPTGCYDRSGRVPFDSLTQDFDLDQIDTGFEVIWAVGSDNQLRRRTIQSTTILSFWQAVGLGHNGQCTFSTQGDFCMSEVSVSNHGTDYYAWAVSTMNEAFMCQQQGRDCNGEDWISVDNETRLIHIEVGDEEVWGVNATNHILKRPVNGSGEWRSVPGEMRYISASGYRYLWGIAPNDRLYNCEMPCDNGEWQYIGENYRLVDATRNYVIGYTNNNVLYEIVFSTAMKDWTRIELQPPPQTLMSLSLSFQLLWGIADNEAIHYCRLPNGCYNGMWTPISGEVDLIDAGYEVIWVVNREFEVFRRSIESKLAFGAWETLSNGTLAMNVTEISLSNDEAYIWGLSTINELFMCRGSDVNNCVAIDNETRLVHIEVGDEEVWGVNATNHILKRPVNGSGEWRSVPGEMRYISASGYRYVWGIAPNDSLYNCEMPCDHGEWQYIGEDYKQIEASRNYVFGVETNNAIVSFSQRGVTQTITDLNSLDTTKFPPTSVITVSRVLAGTLTGVVVAVLLGVVIFCVSYFVCTRLYQMLKAQAGDQATAQHNVPVEDYHEYETVDEAFGLAEHGTTTNENNNTRPPQESYFDESGSSVITQSNPAYVSNIEDVSTQDNVSYQKSSPYVTVIA